MGVLVQRWVCVCVNVSVCVCVCVCWLLKFLANVLTVQLSVARLWSALMDYERYIHSYSFASHKEHDLFLSIACVGVATAPELLYYAIS